MKGFSNLLINWYADHKRDLPWRKTRDPYKIWVSEIILQQTRVEQGLPYYERFIEKFPSVAKLAKATEDEVLLMWEGLGYYSRARNLHETAKQVLRSYKGHFPKNYSGLIKLKGIGDYTASAISSFCFDEEQAVLDGNVIRVLTRYFGFLNPIDSKTKNQLRQFAQELLPSGKSAPYNQAIMEFGALQCVPRSPDCKNCLLKKNCYAFTHKMVEKLPVKTMRTKVHNRYLAYLLFFNGKEIYIRKRTENDIWKSLWELLPVDLNVENFLKMEPIHLFLEKHRISPVSIGIPVIFTHQLTHQKLHIIFYPIKIRKIFVFNGLNKISAHQINEYSFPVVIKRYLNQLEFV